MNKLLLLPLIAIFFLGCVSNPGDQQTPILPPTNQPPIEPPNTNPPILPFTPKVSITYEPSQPLAGDTVTFTASTTLPAQVERMEIWIRQHGGWVTTPCTNDPCTAKWEQVEVGTLNYYAKATFRDGSVGYEPERDYFILDIQTAFQTNDTLPPSISVFHDPANPKVNQNVTLSALVEDRSGLTQVEIYVDEALKKSCNQRVKISQCNYVSTFPVGAHTYKVLAIDTVGNVGISPDKNFTVSAS
ncbi:MAG: hypothetical protein Q8P05_02615 [Candidatus Diapherotrites archaeon]|nr:hypothetical protein [Candidatus Diapherotrites archaeon]MDZ4256225.1 hypothetical protein [archaeon]